jgi:hypothetical protein
LYEFQDFRWKLLANQHIINDSSPAGIARAKERWWAQEQQEILKELQGWLDQGWEAVQPPGPDCYEINVHRESMIKGRRGWVLFIFFTILTAGILLLILGIIGFIDERYYASAFHLQLRRPLLQASEPPTTPAEELPHTKPS